MAGLVTVMTAVHGVGAGYLAEAYASLVGQEMPEGWGWQWVIQEDGEGGEVAPYVPEDARVSFGQGRRAGAAVARTLALSRAEGEFVRVLDADDMLAPGALARDVRALSADASVGWATSRALDLLPDGSTVGFEGDPVEGVIERGAVLEYWKEHGFRAQVHPASLCVRRELLLALGGWMALPASEDTGLLMALNAVSRGWFSAQTGLLYRKWPGQVTSQAAHGDEGERRARFGVVEARARALAAMGGWRYGGE